MSKSRVLPTPVAPLALALALVACRSLPGPATERPVSVTPGVPFAEGGEKTRIAFRTDEGVRVWLEEDHVTPVVSLQLWFRSGLADEPPGAAGALDVLTGWLMDAPRAGGVSITDTVRAWGGQSRAWTSPDATVFEWLVPSTRAAAVATLAADLVRRPPDDADGTAFERSRRAVLEGLSTRQGEPLSVATSALFARAFAVHPYGRALAVTAEDVRALSAAHVRASFQSLLRPDRLALLMAGDFDRRAIKPLLASALTGRGEAAGRARDDGAASSPDARPVEPPRTSPRVSVMARPPQEGDGVVAFGFPLPSASDEDVLAGAVLAAALAGEPQGRLQTALVRNRHLASSVEAFLLTGRDPGLLVFQVRLGPGTLEEAVQVASDEMARLGREELSADELGRARLLVMRDQARARSTLEGYVRRLGWSATMLGSPEAEEKLRARVGKLNPSALRRAAARALSPQAVSLVALVPDGEARGQTERAAASRARLEQLVRETPGRLERMFAEHPPKPESLRRARGGVMVARRTLASGVHAVVVSDRALSQVYARAVWSGGLRAEDVRDFGAAQLIARVLARGPRSLSAEETTTRLGAAGGTLEGFADQDSMGVEVDLVPDAADAGLAVLVESLRHPRFSDEDVEGAKRLLIDRRRGDERDPSDIARRAFFEGLWPRHPYRLDPRGSTVTLAALDRRRLLDHYRRQYPLSDATLFVAGDVDAEQILKQLDRWLGDKRDQGPSLLTQVVLPTAILPRAAGATEPIPAEPTQIFRTSDRDETHVLLGARAPGRRESDLATAQVLWEVLAGADGRLRRAVGTLVPLTSCRTTWFSALEGSAMGIDLAVPPDKLSDVVAALRSELARFLADGADPRELARARDWLVGRRSLSLEDRSEVFTAMARDEALGLGLDAYRAAVDRLATVEVADVNRWARSSLSPDKLVLTVVQPAEGKSR